MLIEDKKETLMYVKKCIFVLVTSYFRIVGKLEM